MVFTSYAPHLYASSEPIGLIKGVQGEAIILRNPSQIRTHELDLRARQQGFDLMIYNRLYWEAYTISKPVELRLGDVLMTGTGSRVYAVIQDQHHLALAENTVTQLLPDFIHLQQSRQPRVELKLHSGRVRMQAGSSEIGLRSRTVAATLQQAETLFAVHAKSSQLVGLQGKINVTIVQPEESLLYNQSLNDFQQQDFERLNNRSAMRQRMGGPQPRNLAAGYLQVFWQDLSHDEQVQLRNLNPSRQGKPKQGEIRKAREADLRYYEQILPDMNKFLESIDFYPIHDEPADDLFLSYSDLEFEDENLPSPPPTEIQKPSSNRAWLSIRLGYGDLSTTLGVNNGIGVNLGALELELRPFKYAYTYLAVASGKAQTKDMANYLGLGEPIALNTYSQFSAGLGFRIPIGSRLGLNLGASILNMQQLIIQYEDLPSNINRTYTLSMQPVPMAELGLGLQVSRDFELFFRYSQGQSRAKFEANDISSSYQSKSELAYGILAVAWLVH